MTASPHRRLALAGLLGGAVLATSAGLAYAGTAVPSPDETGYATVVDERGQAVTDPSPGVVAADPVPTDCPDDREGDI